MVNKYNSFSSNQNELLEKQVEEALLGFHNEFLTGFDYSQKIEYPKSSRFRQKQRNLLLAIGSDIAIFLSFGKSEVVVKKFEAGILTTDIAIASLNVLEDDPVKQAIEFGVAYAMEEGAKYGVEKIIATKVSAIPIHRSFIAIYSFSQAKKDDVAFIYQSINEQRELNRLFGDVAETYLSIYQTIKKIDNPDKKRDYSEVLSAMMYKKAQLSVYRQMQIESNYDYLIQLVDEILKPLNLATVKLIEDGSITIDHNLRSQIRINVITDCELYLQGLLNKDDLTKNLKDYLGELNPFDELMIPARINSQRSLLRNIEKTREKVNYYGGSEIIHSNQRINNYEELSSNIDFFLRILSTLDIEALSSTLPENIIWSEPLTGTIVPDWAKQPVEIYLKRIDAPLIAFIIDTSGSMGWNDPKNVRHSAMKMIIDRLQGHENVFIVDFDGKATWINPNHYKNWNRDQLKRYVDQLGADGTTNIGLGMDVMRNVLEPRMGSDTKIAVMLFTDGKGNFDNNDEWYAQNNIPVYTVGYEAEADASLMQRIATNTNGVFLLAQNEKEIANTFIQFLNALMDFNMIFNQSDAISQGQEIEYTFYVEENTTHLNASTSWLGSKIGLILRAPGMRTFREHGQGSWFTGRNYTNFNLENPPAGEWTAILTGDNIPGETEPFTFQVSGDTPAKFSLQNQIDGNGLIRLVLEGEGNIPDINQIKPTVRVRTPDNRQQDISDRFANGRLNYYPMSGEGGYQFEVSFNASAPGGGRIQRHLMSSVFLGEYQPAYLGVIDHILGNYITTGLGRHRGNRPGIKVEIFEADGDFTNPIAMGYVTSVNADNCQIQIQYRTQRVKVGDIIKLDVTQWHMDDP